MIEGPCPYRTSNSPCFFFNDTATTEIYTLSLHDALPICPTISVPAGPQSASHSSLAPPRQPVRSEEHTSELQSHHDLVCRLLLENKKHGMNSVNTATKSINTMTPIYISQ